MPEGIIRGMTATEFEDITATTLRDLGCEVDYNPGSLRWPDIVVDGWGVECKKNRVSWKTRGNMITNVNKTKDILEVWIFYLNQKLCDIRYCPHHRAVEKIVPDIRYREVINMNWDI